MKIYDTFIFVGLIGYTAGMFGAWVGSIAAALFMSGLLCICFLIVSIALTSNANK